MTIACLPPDCARAVRSASVLSDPCSVAKELIDNSLDAGATSISVELSANTLDIIQVKDNGAGIHPNDRHLVCKRNCTSKLQTIDELKNVGGSTLGFRGEALASAAEMCGGIQITTRTSGELVGTSLTYDRAGLLVSCTKASHPVGTTVRVSEFLRFVPVRKQTALKSISKTVSRMKKILNAYVLSRPEIRLSFKILGKNDHRWAYPSKQNATVSDALLKVVGVDIMSQCATIVWPQIHDDEDGSLSGSIDGNEINCPVTHLVATIPKPGFDCTKINHAGQYVSIDRRPMATSRGVAKELVKLFKSYIRSTSLCDENQTSPVDPFLFLHLHCRPGSYDTNVEPSKDDVLFEDLKLVLSMAENVFRNVYGEIRPRSNCWIEDKDSSVEVVRPCSLSASSHRTSDAEGPALFRPMLGHEVKDRHSTDHTFASSLQTNTSNVLSTRYSTDRASCPQQAADNASFSEDSRSTNPWILAKKKYVTPRKEKTQSPESHPYLLTPVYEDELCRCENKLIGSCGTNSGPSIPPTPSPLFIRVAKYGKSPGDVGKSQRSELRILPQTRAIHSATQRRELEGVGSFDACIRNCQVSWNPFMEESQDVGISPIRENDENGLAETAIAGPFGKESHGNVTGRNQGDSLVELSSSALLSAPSIQIIRESDDPVLAISSEKYDNQISRIRESADNRPNSTSQEMIAMALNFEYQKRAAVQLHKQNQQHLVSSQATLLSWTGANGAKTSQSSPYQKRYLRAKADLVSQFPRPKYPECDASLSLPKMEPEDPRAYFMRRKNALTQAGVSIKRGLRNQLPLEMIPNEFALHGLTVNWKNQDDEWSTPGNELSKTDEYIQTGIVPPPPAFFEVQLTDISLWTTRLSAHIREQYRSENGDRGGETQLIFDAIATSTCNNIVA
ncbi:hypothetical protein AJ78_00142 [Emergomyces pasteurianus Ep9510]|uniref:DNA mismatch repair protein S5 domain-containing protein n=1 Tax=Emergomyces pasteurianus Ep9510 TaxID=1447872 RepID=A0A1J9QVR0_9EURO|nr:hypothetical protein AJ78_00142 [Emergomyces pasteurianus Ep9510]